MAGGVAEGGPGGAGTIWAGSSAPPAGAVVTLLAGAAAGPAATGVRGVRAWLGTLEVGAATDRERVELVAELERVKGALAAVQARATHALRESREAVDPREAARSVGSQVALARRCSPSLGDRFVGLARALVTEMPATHAALTQGVCSERHAVLMVKESAALSREDRAVLDARVGPLLGRLGVTATERAARRVAAELDAAAVVARMEAAVASRRVSVRAAPDGMAYLTVLGPMVQVVGAHAALLARSRAVAGGQCPDEAPGGRAAGAVAADTALALMSGRSPGRVQPVEVHLVMTDRALLGTGAESRSVMEPARLPGHGSLPAPVARWWLRDADEGSVWLRRLYTSPGGRDLVAMDSRRRTFTGLLRRMLVLRDDRCTTPWCDAPIAHADHATPARHGGATTYDTGNGKCARCNHTKEAPGWHTSVTERRDADPHVTERRVTERRVREVVVRTPLGITYRSQPPPLLGWGTQMQPAAPTATDQLDGTHDLARGRAPGGPRRGAGRREPEGAAPGRGKPPRPIRTSTTPATPTPTSTTPRTGPPRRPVRRRAQTPPPIPKRPRLTSRLERQLCRYLT